MERSSDMSLMARSVGAGRRKTARRTQRGGDILGIGNFFRKAGQWVKDNKVISRGLSAFPNPIAKAGSALAASIGLGRRRRTVRRRRVGGNKLIDFFKKSHAYVKKNRLVSKALKDHGFSRASSIAGILGYGKRKRTVRRRRVGGNKILDFLKKGHAYVKKQRLISKALKDHGFKRASNIAGVLGYGRQPIRRRRRTIC